MTIVATTPFDSAGFVLQQAIVITGDTAGPAGIQGNILNPNQPGVLPLMNLKYRELQDRLISNGVETYNKYGYLYGIPPANTSNPSSQVSIDFAGFFDGQNKWAKWTLPVDCLKILEMWERQSGNNYWSQMTPVADSISTRPIMPFFHEWDYETDVLYLPPQNQTNDLKFKYLCYAPDITTVNSPILVARCQSALAYRVAAEIAKMRGGLEMAGIWNQDADNYEKAIVNRTARSEAYKSFFRLPFRGRRGGRGRN